MHLIADQVPLLLVVVLPEEPRFVWRQIHRVLKIEEGSISFMYDQTSPFCLYI